MFARELDGDVEEGGLVSSVRSRLPREVSFDGAAVQSRAGGNSQRPETLRAPALRGSASPYRCCTMFRLLRSSHGALGFLTGFAERS